MKKLLGLTIGTLLLSSAVMAQNVKPEMPDDMPPPPQMDDEMHLERRKHFSEADKAKFEEKMKERKAEFVKRLNLTPEQKEKAEALHAKNKAAMKPIMDEMKKLREKADSLREESRKEFEALLTDTQKEILKTMHKERIEKGRERFHKRFKGKRLHDQKGPQQLPEKAE